MCRNINSSGIVIEVDAASIVTVLENSVYANNIISPILDDCRSLISHMQQTCIRHCFRQANRCADSLARLGFSQPSDFSFFDSPPVDMINMFEDDLNGVYIDRLCSAPFVLS